ncbi:hypothetical protein C2142_18950 [Streptomyces sp. CB01881]|nr:hypothetical protein C2142_18950 [Streptomyces sp. CB01881]
MKSRQEALDWAEQLTAHLSQVAGIQINDEPAQQVFTSCVGRNGESATDGRFTLDFAVHSNVPNAGHNEVVRKVREVLTNEGLKITDYQEAPPTKATAILTARHPNSQYVVDVSSTAGDDRMVLGITTPCLMPPSGSPSSAPTATS